MSSWVCSFLLKCELFVWLGLFFGLFVCWKSENTWLGFSWQSWFFYRYFFFSFSFWFFFLTFQITKLTEQNQTDYSRFGLAFLPYKSVLVSSMAKLISSVRCKNCLQNRQTQTDYTPSTKMGEPRLLLMVEASLGREEE